MSRRHMLRSLVVITLLAALAAVVGVPIAAAQEEAPAETSEEADPTLMPAVEVPEEVPDEGEDEWTFRFLVPTAIALAVVGVLVTVIQYFTRVTRARQRVVE